MKISIIRLVVLISVLLSTSGCSYTISKDAAEFVNQGNKQAALNIIKQNLAPLDNAIGWCRASAKPLKNLPKSLLMNADYVGFSVLGGEKFDCVKSYTSTKIITTCKVKPKIYTYKYTDIKSIFVVKTIGTLDCEIPDGTTQLFIPGVWAIDVKNENVDKVLAAFKVMNNNIIFKASY